MKAHKTLIYSLRVNGPFLGEQINREMFPAEEDKERGGGGGTQPAIQPIIPKGMNEQPRVQACPLQHNE